MLFATFQIYFLLFHFLKLSLLLFAYSSCAKIPISNFTEAQDLLSRAHESGAHLSYGHKRREETCSYENNMHSVLANIRMKLDLNETWFSARFYLVHSLLRLHKELACYFVGKEVNWVYTSDYFKKLSEIEGILCLLVQCSTFSQNEKLWNGALGVSAKKHMMRKLLSDKVSLMDLSSVSKSHKIQRINVESSFMKNWNEMQTSIHSWS